MDRTKHQLDGEGGSLYREYREYSDTVRVSAFGTRKNTTPCSALVRLLTITSSPFSFLSVMSGKSSPTWSSLILAPDTAPSPSPDPSSSIWSSSSASVFALIKFATKQGPTWSCKHKQT